MSTEQEIRVLTHAREMFMRYGIRSVTMDDIARELGISKKTLYQNVDNKADLIDRIVEMHIQNEKGCLSAITGDSADAIDELLSIARYVLTMLKSMQPTTMFDLKKYYHTAWKKMDRFHLGHVYSVIRQNIERGMREGLYRGNLNADIISKLYVGKTMLLNDEEMFPGSVYDRQDLFVEYIHYHLRGILSTTGLAKLQEYPPLSS
jgi:AcrR family transcriptional regulator